MAVIYPIIRDYEKCSDAFAVTADEGSIGVYECDVSAVPFNQVWPGYQRPHDQTEPAWYASLGSDGEISLRITPKKAFTSVTVRPLSKKITPSVGGGSVLLTLPGPGQYSVEFSDGDDHGLSGIHHTLTLFVNPEKEFDVDPDDKTVIYFGAGVHEMTEPLELSDNQTVYIDKGAVVYGSIHASNRKNLRILGYGILDNSRFERGKGTPIGIGRSENIRVEGIIAVDSSSWSMHFSGCTNVVVDNIKLIGMWRYNSDGCDFTNSTNCMLKNSYLRNYDDCVVIKGLKGNNTLPVCNVTVEHCVLWCDWGRALEIGAETSAPYMSGIRFQDIDIIHGDAVMMDVQHGDRATVSDISFTDIRCEYTANGRQNLLQKAPGEVYVNRNEDFMPALAVVGTIHTMWSVDDATGNLYDVRFKNISVLSENGRMPDSAVFADAKNTEVRGVHFENVTLNGVPVTDFDALHLRIGSGTDDVTVR